MFLNSINRRFDFIDNVLKETQGIVDYNVINFYLDRLHKDEFSFIAWAKLVLNHGIEELIPTSKLDFYLSKEFKFKADCDSSNLSHINFF